MNTALALDHLGVAARDLAPMCAAYERLGFTLSPIAQQSGRRRPDLAVEKYGSGNRCAFLKHGYIELIEAKNQSKYLRINKVQKTVLIRCAGSTVFWAFYLITTTY
jgi:hypothetical protein